ncbi:MAG: Ig-like domain-containing protein [Bacteroidota bacterium]
MTKIKHIKLLLLALIVGLPLLLGAQTTSDNIYQGEAYDKAIIEAFFMQPQISIPPSNGTAYFSAGGNNLGTIGQVGFNKVVYVPNDGFSGEDTFTVQYFSAQFVTIKQTYIINVQESAVLAMDDYGQTNVTTPVQVAVLNNDTQDNPNGTLEIRDILVAAGAQNVSVNIDGSITYTPMTDFNGIGYVEYLVCNEAGVCDNATVSISVIENTSADETLQLYTKKNTPQPILTSLDDFQLQLEPSKGFIDNSEDVWTYVPNDGETGDDQFTFVNGVVTKTINVEIIDAEAESVFAIDDYAYTPIGTAVEINYLENDIDAANFASVVILQQPQFGTLAEAETGLVTYTPNAGFQTVVNNPYSVDRFTYQVTKNDGSIEQATVYVYVNDFNPSASTFELSVAKNSPLAIQYAVPVNYHSFKVVSQGDLGQVAFFQTIDQDVYGQRVVGEKVLLYTPTQQVTGQDEFEVQYCVSPNADCRSIKIRVDILDITVPDDEKCVLADCVWEGDTNNDGVVDMQDLLTLGYAIGKTGATRSRTRDAWYGSSATDWANSRYTQVDLKHSDTDGNGLVNSADTAAIIANFGRKHTLTAAGLPAPEPMPIYYGKPDTIPVYGPGAILEIPIIMGNEFFPTTDLYGVEINVNYSTSFLREGTVRVEFDQDSWFSYGSANLSLSKEVVSGRIAAASTRTNLAFASGHGQIAKTIGISIADIDAFRLGDEELEGKFYLTATGITSNGTRIDLGSDEFTFKIDPNKVEEEVQPAELAEGLINVYPNPTADFLNISQNVERVEVFTLTGQRMLDNTNLYQLNVKNWTNGVYILRAHTEDGQVVNEKFEVNR